MTSTRPSLKGGYFKDKNKSTNGSSLLRILGYKLTLAQAWSAGSSFWARPEIRVFAFYLAQDKQDMKGNAFNGGTSDDTWNFGVQAEAWW